MKIFLVALLIGLAAGYAYGYHDARSGSPSVMARTLDKFGVSKVKAANERRARQLDGL